MVHGYHMILSAYGFWLPNDPRGSWSEFVASWELFRYGPATTINSTRSVASAPHHREMRIEAKTRLKCPAVTFSGVQARAVGMGFANCVTNSGLTVWACAILPERLHLVIARNSRLADATMMNQLKGAASKELLAQGLHPFERWRTRDGKLPSCWARRGWSVFLDTEEDIGRSIQYVNDNPLKEGKREQRWKFVSPFEGI